MTRGQDGSLRLSCAALSSATLSRFIPALSLTPAPPRCEVLGLFPAASPSSPRPAGLPDSRTQPSGPSLSNHLRMLRLARARYPSAGRTETASPRDISQPELGPSPFPGWLATPRRPNRVQFPPLLGRLLTHWSFTSCCSPPRLATTQLQSVTSYVDLERTSTSPTKRALRRTRAGLPRPSDALNIVFQPPVRMPTTP